MRPGNTTVLLIAIFALIGVIVGLVAWQFKPGGGDSGVTPYGLDTFPVDAYAEAPGNLRGNRYLLRAQIYEQLDRREDVGRIFSVTPTESEARIAVFIPAGIERNVHVGQRYRLEVRVGDKGLIEVLGLETY